MSICHVIAEIRVAEIRDALAVNAAAMPAGDTGNHVTTVQGQLNVRINVDAAAVIGHGTILESHPLKDHGDIATQRHNTIIFAGIHRRGSRATLRYLLTEILLVGADDGDALIDGERLVTGTFGNVEGVPTLGHIQCIPNPSVDLSLVCNLDQTLLVLVGAHVAGGVDGTGISIHIVVRAGRLRSIDQRRVRAQMQIVGGLIDVLRRLIEAFPAQWSTFDLQHVGFGPEVIGSKIGAAISVQRGTFWGLVPVEDIALDRRRALRHVDGAALTACCIQEEGVVNHVRRATGEVDPRAVGRRVSVNQRVLEREVVAVVIDGATVAAADVQGEAPTPVDGGDSALGGIEAGAVLGLVLLDHGALHHHLAPVVERTAVFSRLILEETAEIDSYGPVVIVVDGAAALRRVHAQALILVAGLQRGTRAAIDEERAAVFVCRVMLDLRLQRHREHAAGLVDRAAAVIIAAPRCLVVRHHAILDDQRAARQIERAAGRGRVRVEIHLIQRDLCGVAVEVHEVQTAAPTVQASGAGVTTHQADVLHRDRVRSDKQRAPLPQRVESRRAFKIGERPIIIMLREVPGVAAFERQRMRDVDRL